jgi:putative transposase
MDPFPIPRVDAPAPPSQVHSITTNTIEGFNRQIRKITKTKGGFNSDESLIRLVYLVYKDISKKWQKSISNWAEIISPDFAQ